MLAESDRVLDQLVCSRLFSTLPAAMRAELEKASLKNTLQRLMSCNKLGDWSGSDRLFERAHSFTSIQMTLRVRLLVLKARRMLLQT